MRERVETTRERKLVARMQPSLAGVRNFLFNLNLLTPPSLSLPKTRGKTKTTTTTNNCTARKTLSPRPTRPWKTTLQQQQHTGTSSRARGTPARPPRPRRRRYGALRRGPAGAGWLRRQLAGRRRGELVGRNRSCSTRQRDRRGGELAAALLVAAAGRRPPAGAAPRQPPKGEVAARRHQRLHARPCSSPGLPDVQRRERRSGRRGAPASPPFSAVAARRLTLRGRVPRAGAAGRRRLLARRQGRAQARREGVRGQEVDAGAFLAGGRGEVEAGGAGTGGRGHAPRLVFFFPSRGRGFPAVFSLFLPPFEGEFSRLRHSRRKQNRTRRRSRAAAEEEEESFRCPDPPLAPRAAVFQWKKRKRGGTHSF